MPDERPFLAAIDAEPENRVVRLAYADWLDERGDARGELIHAEEEMRVAPVHSDRYWQLKPRRNELRRSAKRAWLERMNYGGTEYQPVFGEVPGGWKERWRLLREFTERWHELPMGDVGGPIPEGRSRKDRIAPALLAALPPALREWLAFIRDLDRATGKGGVRNFGPGSNDRHEWAEVDGRVYFLNFEGGRESCSVDGRHVKQPDPPVDYTSIYDEAGCSFPHVTTFAFQYLMSTWADKKEAAKFAVRVTRASTVARRLEAAFPVRSEWDGIRIFERTNMVAVLNRNEYFTADELDLQVMVRSPASIDDVPAFILELPAGQSAGFEGF